MAEAPLTSAIVPALPLGFRPLVASGVGRASPFVPLVPPWMR